MAKGDAKVCAVCGRSFEWRKKWERDWDSVRYCSDQCRRRGARPIDDEFELLILELCRARGHSGSICPSEAARAVEGSGDEASWHDLMEPARMAARRLAHKGAIEITQKGAVVDPDSAKGPIRLRLGSG